MKKSRSTILLSNLSGLITLGVLLLLNNLPVYSQEVSTRLPIPPLLDYELSRDGTKVFELVADEGEVQFFNGVSTKTLGYNGNYLGPTIRVRRDDQVSIDVENRLSKPTTIHWHGADVPAESDGGPHQGIRPRRSWTASFQVRQQAATLWYHPHFIETTGQQVYEGLAGLLIIDDDDSDSLVIPDEYGVNDIPIILQERRFNQDGLFQYRPRMPDVVHGYFGNELLVNGAIKPYLEVSRGLTRLRLLNGSNSTLLQLRFEGVESVYQIATDGGYLEEPLALSRIILSPGERVEVLVDFRTSDSENARLIAGTNGGANYNAMEFRVGTQISEYQSVPDTLIPIKPIPESEAQLTRRFELQSGMGGRMLINGKTMKMNRIDERVRLGDTEIWQIINRDGSGMGMMGGMMNQPHSFHIHAVQFQILDINGEPPPPELSGWKDTILIWPGDQFRVITRFQSYPGVYMYHCHLLEHEDNGMMGQFEIEGD